MSSPPATPDFAGAATQQGAANLTAAQQQARLNNPNVSNPYGTQTVTYGPDGTPQVNQTLSPQQQQLYNQYTTNQGLAGQAAQGLFGQLHGLNTGALSPAGSVLNQNALPGMGSTLNTNSLPAMPGDYGSVRDQVINAMMGRSNIALGQQGDQTNSDLIARGIHPGTEAYTREQDALNRQRNDALQQAQIAGGDAATQAMQSDLARRAAATGEQAQQFGQATTNRGLSTAEQAQQFGQSTTNRQQGLQEQLQAAGLTAQQIQMLMGGSAPTTPGFGAYQGNTTVAPSPVYGAAQATANYNTDLWNAATQAQTSQNNGLWSLGNTVLQGLFNL